MISALHTFNFDQCPHRVFLDAQGDPAARDETSEFIQMLWENGNAHSTALVSRLGVTANLADVPQGERERATWDAMSRGEPLIYGGRLTVGDRVSDPDLLERHDGGYRAGAIKAGCGFEGQGEAAKYKRDYAMQVAHYTDMLNELGIADSSGEAFIIDGKGARVPYPLNTPQGIRNPVTWMQSYKDMLPELRVVISGNRATRPALAACCKLCHWHSHCLSNLVEADDLTLIPELGRSKRDAMCDVIPTVAAFAASHVEDFFAEKKKTIFPGIGQDTLVKYHARAILLTTPNAQPYLKSPVTLPVAAKEIHLDLEGDPLSGGYIYMHGCVEHPHGDIAAARYVPFITPGVSPALEEDAFAQAWAYLQERLDDSVIYYYSPYENVMYRALATRYPAVCSVEEVEEFFAHPHVIDLYTNVVRKFAEFPTHDYSIKTLAKWFGFTWRDSNPSGAASIQWFHDWLKSGDDSIMNRIKLYNNDDCLATSVLVAGIREMRVKPAV